MAAQNFLLSLRGQKKVLEDYPLLVLYDRTNDLLTMPDPKPEELNSLLYRLTKALVRTFKKPDFMFMTKPDVDVEKAMELVLSFGDYSNSHYYETVHVINLSKKGSRSGAVVLEEIFKKTHNLVLYQLVNFFTDLLKEYNRASLKPAGFINSPLLKKIIKWLAKQENYSSKKHDIVIIDDFIHKLSVAAVKSHRSEMDSDLLILMSQVFCSYFKFRGCGDINLAPIGDNLEAIPLIEIVPYLASSLWYSADLRKEYSEAERQKVSKLMEKFEKFPTEHYTIEDLEKIFPLPKKVNWGLFILFYFMLPHWKASEDKK